MVTSVLTMRSLRASEVSCCQRRAFSYDGRGRLESTWIGDGDEKVAITYGPAGLVTVTDALLAFPIAFLLLMIPLPAIVFNQITLLK